MDENTHSNLYDPDQDEAEEALSLCDLPIYSNWEDFSKEDQNQFQSSPSNQDCFEFFSDDQLSINTLSSSSSSSSENILFCGKLIPYREQPISINHSNFKTNKQEKPKTSKSKKGQPKLEYISSSKSQIAGKCGENCGFSIGKVFLRSPPHKSRWYLLMFGSARFPVEMELRDMRSRQRRQAPAKMVRPEGGGEAAVSGGRRRVKGLWGLIRALGCGRRHHSNAIVKDSFGCVALD